MRRTVLSIAKTREKNPKSSALKNNIVIILVLVSLYFIPMKLFRAPTTFLQGSFVVINSVLPKPKNNVCVFLVETGDTHLVCHLSCHGSALLIDWGKGGQGWVSTKGLYASGIMHYYITPIGERCRNGNELY